MLSLCFMKVLFVSLGLWNWDLATRPGIGVFTALLRFSSLSFRQASSLMRSLYWPFERRRLFELFSFRGCELSLSFDFLKVSERKVTF